MGINIIYKKSNSSNATTIVLLFCLLNSFISIQAQTFSNNKTVLFDYMHKYFIQEIPIIVDGLPNQIDKHFGIESIQFTIHHERTSDLKIQLQAPDGTTIWVSNRNGGLNGRNYLNTKFTQYAKNGVINNAKAPFSGNYIPDGQISFFNNGSNPNGTWKLLVEDLKEGITGVLDSVSITFGKKPAYIIKKEKCSMVNPQLCSCSKETCELLPDMVIIPYFSKNQIQEFSKDDKQYPGQLKIAVAIGNIGLGPLEVAPDSTITGNCCNNNSNTNIDDKRYDLYQYIYTKVDAVFTKRKVKTGTIYYEKMAGHRHYHVDDWIEMRLVKIENGKRKIICKGAKVSYCLFTTGILNENEKSSIIDNKQYGSKMVNYALGDYFTCSLEKQGISVGGYDYYGMMYEGQYLQLPKGFKNGNYILEIEIDPENKYIESDRTNNTFSMPIVISKQN